MISKVQGIPEKIRFWGEHTFSQLLTHDNEKFENNATLIIEASTTDTKKKSDVFF